MNQKKIFVIVVTYHGQEWYDRCFSSLHRSTVPISIIVVVNGGDDGTREYIQKHFPDIIILDPGENLGFGKGNNLALQYAINHDCEYVFLLNQDTWLVDDNVIEELIRIHAAHPSYGILSPMHLRSDERELWMLLENGTNNCSTQLVSDLYCGSVQEIYETNYVNAAAWLLPKKTLETVGGFDPIFQHYEEDDDYLNRVHFHGLKIGICPSVRIVHDHRKELKNPFENASFYHRKQQLLVSLLDLNNTSSMFGHIRYLGRKLMVSFLGGKFTKAKDYTRDILFVLKNRRKIVEHKAISRTVGPSWL